MIPTRAAIKPAVTSKRQYSLGSRTNGARCGAAGAGGPSSVGGAVTAAGAWTLYGSHFAPGGSVAGQSCLSDGACAPVTTDP
jgi:hypothetical protein